MPPTTPPESNSVGSTVRLLAHDVHQCVAHRDNLPGDLAALRRRIETARDKVRHLPYGAIHRWLDGLERDLHLLTAAENN